MRSRPPVLLLIVTMAVALFIFLVERPITARFDRAIRSPRALALRPDRVSRIEIERGHQTLDFGRENSGRWTMRTPITAPADEAAIRRFLHGLSALPRGATIHPDDMKASGSTLSEFGLEFPAIRIRLTADERAWTLDVGKMSPARDGVYVRFTDETLIVRTTTNLLAWIPAQANDWRERRVFLASPSDIERIELRRPGGFVRLGRNNARDWSLVQPVAARADRTYVETFLEQALALRVEEFVSEDGGERPDAGFEESGLELIFEGGLQDGVRRLLLGGTPPNSPQLRYAKLRGNPSIFLVSAEAVQWAQTPASDFRSRRLTTIRPEKVRSLDVRWGDRKLEFHKEDGAWRMTAPIPSWAEADRVAILIEAWTSARIQGFIEPPATEVWEDGWADPAGEVTIRSADASEPTHIRVHRRSPVDGRILVRVEGAPSLYLISTDLADTLTLDPLLFRDLTALRIDPQTLHRIRRVTADGECQILRGADGVWTSAEGRVDMDVLSPILTSLSHLRAVSWVRHAPSNPAAFGLDPPVASLTIHQSGPDGFILSLLLGRESGMGRYAMIPGHDTVFLLGPEDSEILVAPFVFTNPSPTGEIPK